MEPPTAPLLGHSYVPGSCAYPNCGRSPEAHADLARQVALGALRASPQAAGDHLVASAWRLAEALDTQAAYLRQGVFQAVHSEHIEEIAGLMQANMLPALASEFQAAFTELEALAQPVPNAQDRP